jgi:prepilin-type N-terminal cleavage/methylation domain-containing protein
MWNKTSTSSAAGVFMRPTIRNRAFTLVEIMIVVLIIGVLMSIAVPNFITARSNSQKNSCAANLKQIEGAKEQWAMVAKKGATDTPVSGDLLGSPTAGFLKSWPTCPTGGTYTIGDMSTRPVCSKSADGHTL